VKKLVQEEEWIMDGNYRSTLDIRIPAADTIIWLYFSRFVCLWRAIKRKIKNDRFDRLEGCQEKIDLGFIKWILWTFPRENCKHILEKLGEIKSEGKKEVYIFRSNREIEAFLNDLK
jgi:adenylate kinase family enzyme